MADKTITGIGGLTFDVTSTVQQLATSHAGTWTFALIPDDENNLNYRVHFSNNPHVTTTYDITPSTWSPATSPQPGWANPPAGLPANRSAPTPSPAVPLPTTASSPTPPRAP